MLDKVNLLEKTIAKLTREKTDMLSESDLLKKMNEKLTQEKTDALLELDLIKRTNEAETEITAAPALSASAQEFFPSAAPLGEPAELAPWGSWTLPAGFTEQIDGLKDAMSILETETVVAQKALLDHLTALGARISQLESAQDAEAKRLADIVTNTATQVMGELLGSYAQRVDQQFNNVRKDMHEFKNHIVNAEYRVPVASVHAEPEAALQSKVFFAWHKATFAAPAWHAAVLESFIQAPVKDNQWIHMVDDGTVWGLNLYHVGRIAFIALLLAAFTTTSAASGPSVSSAASSISKADDEEFLAKLIALHYAMKNVFQFLGPMV